MLFINSFNEVARIFVVCCLVNVFAYIDRSTWYKSYTQKCI